jgi:hypothetical protein
VDEHHVPREASVGPAGEGDPGGRPDQALGLAVDDLDYRAVDLEIVEVIRIDGSDGRGVPGDAKVVDYAACRLRRVIPSFERGYRYRAYERTVDVAELDDFTSASLAS